MRRRAQLSRPPCAYSRPFGTGYVPGDALFGAKNLHFRLRGVQKKYFFLSPLRKPGLHVKWLIFLDIVG
jgi:hypothetical protein